VFVTEYFLAFELLLIDTNGSRMPPPSSIGQSVCIYVYVCVCVCWHDGSRSAPSPAARIEGDFNTPTCLGRGTDTVLFPHNRGQTEGAGGRGGRWGVGGGGALAVCLLSPRRV